MVNNIALWHKIHKPRETKNVGCLQSLRRAARRSTLLPINCYIHVLGCCIRHICDWQMRTSPCGSSARRNGLHSGHIVEKCETVGGMIRQTTRLFFKLMRSLKTYLQIPVNLLIGLAAISPGGVRAREVR